VQTAYDRLRAGGDRSLENTVEREAEVGVESTLNTDEFDERVVDQGPWRHVDCPPGVVRSRYRA
jgi:hypothetical protein